MELLGENSNSNNEFNSNKINTVTPSPFHEEFHEDNNNRDIDDLLRIDGSELGFEIQEEPLNTNGVRNPNGVIIDNNNNIINDNNGSINNSLRENSNHSFRSINPNNPYYSPQRDSVARSHSSILKPFDNQNPNNSQEIPTYKINTNFIEEEYKYMPGGISISENTLNSPKISTFNENIISPNFTNDLIDKRKSIASTPSLARDSSGVKNEITSRRGSISNFFSHLISKKNKKKNEEMKSFPELDNDNDKGYVHSADILASSVVKEHKEFRREHRSNTLGEIYFTPPKKSYLKKRQSYIEGNKYNGLGFSPLSPLAIDTKFDSSKSPLHEEENSADIDSVLSLVDENNNTPNIYSNNNMSPLSPSKNKNKLESKSSAFFSHLKRKKDKRNSLTCVTTSDLIQRKKSFIYSSDIIPNSPMGSRILPSYSSVTTSNNHILTPQSSNSQFISNEEILRSSKSVVSKKKGEKSEVDIYKLPDYPDLLVMSESDIDNIYKNMVKEVSHKKRDNNYNNDDINNLNNNNNSNNTNNVKLKDKDNKQKFIESIKEESNSPTSVPVIPSIQNNKDDPLRKSKSNKELNNSYQRSNSNVVSSLQHEDPKISFEVSDENLYVVINSYGIRDIDYSTRRVLPVTNTKNCSEDVDDLFNLANEEQFHESITKLNEIENTHNQYKHNLEVAVNDPNQPNDIDDLFVLSSDIEKKMTVLDSYVVVDDIQENIRPDIGDVLNIVDHEGENQQNSNKKSSEIINTLNSIGGSKDILRKISKTFSKVKESTSFNGEESIEESQQQLLNPTITPTDLLVIPSYNENNTTEGGGEEEKMNICLPSDSYDDFKKSNPNMLNSKSKIRSISMNQGEFIMKSPKQMMRSLDRLNTNNTLKKFEGSNGQPLNYVHALSQSLSIDGLVVVSSNDNVVANEDERMDYIYYNRESNQKRNRRKGSVMDDFIEFSTVNPQLQKKIINEFNYNSLSSYRKATVRDFYDVQDEEHSIYNSMNINKLGSIYSIPNNNGNIISSNTNLINNKNDLIRRGSSISDLQRNRLYSYTNINQIRNELSYYNNNNNNNNNYIPSIGNLHTANSISINNFKFKNNQSFNGFVPFDSIIFDHNPSQLSLVEEVENNNNAKQIIYEANKALEINNNDNNNNNSTFGIINNYSNNNNNNNNGNNSNNNQINYYLNITNLMNDDQKKNRDNMSLEIPQFTTGYSINNNYISRMRLISPIDIYNRLEALNQTNNVHFNINKSRYNNNILSNSRSRDNKK